MNTESELIKNVHDSPTKQIDPKLKGSVTCLIRSEQAKLLNVECGSVELTSDIGSARTAIYRRRNFALVRTHKPSYCSCLPRNYASHAED